VRVPWPEKSWSLKVPEYFSPLSRVRVPAYIWPFEKVPTKSFFVGSSNQVKVP